jgi:hypothetical protein
LSEAVPPRATVLAVVENVAVLVGDVMVTPGTVVSGGR